jgi:hypothetical protein
MKPEQIETLNLLYGLIDAGQYSAANDIAASFENEQWLLPAKISIKLSVGELESANSLAKSVEIHSISEDDKLLLSSKLLAINENEQALSLLRTLENQSTDVILQSCQALIFMRRPKDAYKILTTLPSSDRDSPLAVALTCLAICHSGEGTPNFGKLLQMLNRKDLDIDILYISCFALLSRRKRKDASVIALRAIELYPTHVGNAEAFLVLLFEHLAYMAIPEVYKRTTGRVSYWPNKEPWGLVADFFEHGPDPAFRKRSRLLRSQYPNHYPLFWTSAWIELFSCRFLTSYRLFRQVEAMQTSEKSH